MGSAVSLTNDTLIDLNKAKELLENNWNNEIEEKLKEIIINNNNQPITLLKLKEEYSFYFETKEEKEIRLNKEYNEILLKRSNGNVIINYQMYNELFPIVNNTLTSERINEDYGLYDVMPGCQIKLSQIDSKARTLYSNNHNGIEAPWIKEDPIGTFIELLADETYYCIVIENPEQYARDMEQLTNRLLLEGNNILEEKRAEGCSCLYGNPCVDQYICKDWDNRFAVSKKNGWKGF